MKSVLLVALFALLALGASAREVREYVSELEVVDHLEGAPDESLSPGAAAAPHSLMETSTSSDAPAGEMGRSFAMMSDSELAAEEPVGLMEMASEEEFDTAVARQMALEIHDAAQEALNGEDESAAMLIELAEPVLSAAELAQEAADKAAEAAAKLAEARDNAEEAADKKEAARDAAAAKTAAAAADTAAPATDAPASGSQTVITLPGDMSAEHAEMIRVNEAATKTIRGALSEMNGILDQKDSTIRSLVANITYLTVNIGKLANKVDLQRSYIGLLRNKLHLANRKNKQLHNHVEHSTATVKSVRGQLKAMEARLNSQDQKTASLSDFLTKHQDKIELPALNDDLVVRGPRTTEPRHRHNRPARLARRVRQSLRGLRPVEGTQVYADAHSIPARRTVFVPADNAPAQYYSSAYFAGAGVSPFTHPTYTPYGDDGIPTIIVEREDNGA